MSRYTITYPPQMLPPADDPETATVVVWRPSPDSALRRPEFPQQVQPLANPLPGRGQA